MKACVFLGAKPVHKPVFHQFLYIHYFRVLELHGKVIGLAFRLHCENVYHIWCQVEQGYTYCMHHLMSAFLKMHINSQSRCYFTKLQGNRRRKKNTHQSYDESKSFALSDLHESPVDAYRATWRDAVRSAHQASVHVYDTVPCFLKGVLHSHLLVYGWAGLEPHDMRWTQINWFGNRQHMLVNSITVDIR